MRFRFRSAVHRPGTAARFVASAAALLLVAGQFGSYAHLMVVRHELCAEHGELVDVPQGAVARADLAEPATGASHLAPSSEPAAGHQHEHCAIAPHRRERTVEARHHLAIGAAPPTSDQSLLAIATVRPSPLTVYRLAPKTSPPA